jgi:hypothetical protein
MNDFVPFQFIIGEPHERRYAQTEVISNRESGVGRSV